MVHVHYYTYTTVRVRRTTLVTSSVLEYSYAHSWYEHRHPYEYRCTYRTSTVFVSYMTTPDRLSFAHHQHHPPKHPSTGLRHRSTVEYSYCTDSREDGKLRISDRPAIVRSYDDIPARPLDKGDPPNSTIHRQARAESRSRDSPNSGGCAWKKEATTWSRSRWGKITRHISKRERQTTHHPARPRDRMTEIRSREEEVNKHHLPASCRR